MNGFRGAEGERELQGFNGQKASIRVIHSDWSSSGQARLQLVLLYEMRISSVCFLSIIIL